MYVPKFDLTYRRLKNTEEKLQLKIEKALFLNEVRSLAQVEEVKRRKAQADLDSITTKLVDAEKDKNMYKRRYEGMVKLFADLGICLPEEH